MKLPANIAALVSIGLVQVANSPFGALSLRTRREIWRAYREWLPSRVSPEKSGHRRRLALGILCFRRVLPLFEAILPNERFPHEMLALAETPQMNENEARCALQQLQLRGTMLENWSSLYMDQPAVVDVAWAAWQLAFLALRDEGFLRPEFADIDADDQTDAYDHDVAFRVAAAESGEPYEGDEATVNLRRRFWNWYLSEGVIRAFHVDSPEKA